MYYGYSIPKEEKKKLFFEKNTHLSFSPNVHVCVYVSIYAVNVNPDLSKELIFHSFLDSQCHTRARRYIYTVGTITSHIFSFLSYAVKIWHLYSYSIYKKIIHISYMNVPLSFDKHNIIFDFLSHQTLEWDLRLNNLLYSRPRQNPYRFFVLTWIKRFWFNFGFFTRY